MNNLNNILSYFVKDITDLKEKALYIISIDYFGYINIYYKTCIIYWCKNNNIANYIKNINKEIDIYIQTNKIFKNFKFETKQIYYTSRHKYGNITSIIYCYHLKKYLLKHTISYCVKSINVIKIRIIYYNMYKYKYKMNIFNTNNKNKFMILFTNKYELNYINTFFLLYFALIN